MHFAHCLVFDFACQLVASGYGRVTQERYSVSPPSGKQNGCAIKSVFRRSAGCPSLPADNPFGPAAHPNACHCALNLNRGGSPLKASQPWVFIGGQCNLMMSTVNPFPGNRTQGSGKNKGGKFNGLLIIFFPLKLFCKVLFLLKSVLKNCFALPPLLHFTR